MFWVERGTEEAKESDLKNCHCVAFKNCKTAHFVGKFFMKLLMKWPLKHFDRFCGKLLLANQSRRKKCEKIYRHKSTHVSRLSKSIDQLFMTSLKIYLRQSNVDF